MNRVGPIQLRITSDANCLPVVRGAVDRLACAEGFDEEGAHGLAWAIDEALANVIKHGYGGRSGQPIEIDLTAFDTDDGRRAIEIVIRDEGRQVAPDTIRSRDLEEVRPGGLGVHIIKTVMDETTYTCLPQCGMQLRMVKYAASPDAAAQSKRDPTSSGKSPAPDRSGASQAG